MLKFCWVFFLRIKKIKLKIPCFFEIHLLERLIHLAGSKERVLDLQGRILLHDESSSSASCWKNACTNTLLCEADEEEQQGGAVELVDHYCYYYCYCPTKCTGMSWQEVSPLLIMGGAETHASLEQPEDCRLWGLVEKSCFVFRAKLWRYVSKLPKVCSRRDIWVFFVLWVFFVFVVGDGDGGSSIWWVHLSCCCCESAAAAETTGQEFKCSPMAEYERRIASGDVHPGDKFQVCVCFYSALCPTNSCQSFAEEE